MHERTSLVQAAGSLGLMLLVGLAALGYLIADGMRGIKSMERTMEVKGLSEREVAADIAIWPLAYSVADNDLGGLYARIRQNNEIIQEFLRKNGFSAEEIGVSPPTVVDKQAREYGGDGGASPFRYTGQATVTVYSRNVEQVRATMTRLVELGQQGIPISSTDWGTQFMFSGLNQIKPEMIEEATRNAREAAGKFAQDSQSRLGKIRRASQGQFSIEDRDSSTPHIKKIRVVSTVEYYLVD